MKKFFSCLFVKFVLYTGRFLGEGTGFLLSFIGLNSINGKSMLISGGAAGGYERWCPSINGKSMLI